jgi:hypothetical protein
MICTLSTIRFAVQLGIERLGRAEHWRKIAVCPSHRLGASIVRRAGIGQRRKVRIAGRQEVARIGQCREVRIAGRQEVARIGQCRGVRKEVARIGLRREVRIADHQEVARTGERREAHIGELQELTHIAVPQEVARIAGR